MSNGCYQKVFLHATGERLSLLEPGIDLEIFVELLNHNEVAVPGAAVSLSIDPQAAVELPPGTQVAGFTIERKIGEGGMAWLYLAVDAAGQRRVLKIPRGSQDADPASLVAFENELRLALYLEDFPHAHMPVAQHSDRLWSHLRQSGCLWPNAKRSRSRKESCAR
mgnify:CR=1 FL=1